MYENNQIKGQFSDYVRFIPIVRYGRSANGIPVAKYSSIAVAGTKLERKGA